jgi:hypothetical protein
VTDFDETKSDHGLRNYIDLENMAKASFEDVQCNKQITYANER